MHLGLLDIDVDVIDLGIPCTRNHLSPTLLNFGFTKPTPATLNKQIEAEPDLNNNQIYGIIAVRGGLMFVDFVGHPYPRIYVSSNLYLIIHISIHRFYHFKQSSCTPVIHDGNTLNTVIFSDQAVKTGIIYFELFNYLNQHQSKYFF